VPCGNCTKSRSEAGANANRYLAPRFDFLAAFRCAFAYLFTAFRCFLDAFFNNLCCCLAVFLEVSRDSRAYSATPGLCALAGIEDAMLNAPSSVRLAIRFIRVFFPHFEPAPVYACLASLWYQRSYFFSSRWRVGLMVPFSRAILSSSG
jgi:hypothetical protein